MAIFKERWSGPQDCLLGVPARVALASTSLYNGVGDGGKWTGGKFASVGKSKKKNVDSKTPGPKLVHVTNPLAGVDLIDESVQARKKCPKSRKWISHCRDMTLPEQDAWDAAGIPVVKVRRPQR